VEQNTERKNPVKHQKRSADILRKISQIIFFCIVLLLAVGNWLRELGLVLSLIPEASLHAVCPFGGVVTVYEFITSGTFIQKIHSSSFILMGLGFVVALLFGSIFCGYICPFGTFQEWLGKLGRRLFPKRFNRIVPKKLDNVLRYLRYALLVIVIYQTAQTAQLIFQNIDPYYALFNFFTGEVAVTAYIVLGVVALLSLIVERPWCKYLCPYGALLGLFNPIRIFKLRRNTDSCISCRKCDNACPMNIEVSKRETISSPQCISCHRCTSASACPVENTVTLSSSAGRSAVLERDKGTK
jgi:polyferredoxin